MTRFRGTFAIFVAALMLPLCASSSAAEDSSVELRIAFGGGPPRQWQGRISISEGRLGKLRLLGLEADQAACVFQPDDRVIQIAHRSPRSYDGLDVLVSAPLSARLTLELQWEGGPDEPYRAELSLKELLAEYHVDDLDTEGNRILVRRAPGDDLRVEFQRDSLVFAPAEPFSVRVVPHLLDMVPQSAVRCELQLLRARSDEVLWSEEFPLTVQPDGNTPPVGPVEVKLPQAEGVYDLVVSISSRRFRDTLVRSKPLRQRHVQLVVVDSVSPPADSTPWQLVEEVAPNGASWRDWWARMPKLPLMPDLSQKPLVNQPVRQQQRQGQMFVELDAQGWQALPLPIDSPGVPHILEIEYPRDQPQSLGISLVEPNAAGQVVPIGLDSGVLLTAEDVLPDAPPGRHRLVFWPRTKTPLVLLTNRRSDTPAAYGAVRVYAGPRQLPPSEFPMIRDERLVAAFFNKPLFNENFGASEAFDDWTQRSLDDWQTFYEGGRRLVEYLKYSGQNAAVLTVVCEGSSLYPSPLLQPNPKYDTGAHFTTGQDPIRKDVLEMLFRMFDREGLQLIPLVQFATPLPEVEAVLRQGGPAAVGVEMTDLAGNTWTRQHGTRRGLAPYYNPLHRDVQQAMQNVLAEIAERYGDHAAFSGLAIQLGQDTYTVFPDALWGADAGTVGRFRSDQRRQAAAAAPPGSTPAGSPNTFDTEAWLQWRSRQLAQFYLDLHRGVVAQAPKAKLLLTADDLFSSRTMQLNLRPRLSVPPNDPKASVRWIMQQHGLDADLLRNQEQVVLLRPQLLIADQQLPAQTMPLQLGMPAVDDHFGSGKTSGSLFYHEPWPINLPSFDQLSPFGSDVTQLSLVSQFTPAGLANRQRLAHSLAVLDSQIIVDGGWMLPLGQEDAARPLIEIVRQLPGQAFSLVPNDEQLETTPQPVVMRQLQTDGRRYFYLVNDSPWPVTTVVQLASRPDGRLQPLGSRPLPSATRQGDQLTWTVAMEPYDVIGAVVTRADSQILGWQTSLDRSVYDNLRDQLTEVRARTTALQNPTSLEALVNDDFEEPNLQGWVHAQREGATVQADNRHAFIGKQSLHMSSQGPVAWVRSDPFPAPTTGRISVLVRLRTADNAQQPPLRLAIDGNLDGQPFYRWAEVGAKTNKPLAEDWGPRPFLLNVDFLPTSGLTDFRIGFDLMGPGQVWIDDVQVYDRWFFADERSELQLKAGVAQSQLNKGRVSDCRRFLNSYWPRFLEQYVEVRAPRVAAQPKRADSLEPVFDQPGDAATEPDEEKPSMLDRMKIRLPKKVFPF